MFKFEIVDNFLNNEDFSELCSVKLKNIKNTEMAVYHNIIYENGHTVVDCLSEKFVKRLFDNYHNKTIKLLEKLNRKKVDLYEYSDFCIIESGANFKFPIHADTTDKLLSGVVYLKPKNNEGTVLYDNKKGENRTEIEWKQNRALFFSRSENNTYHSFRGDNKSNRIVLVYNLMTTNKRGVCKAEDINYPMVRIKEFLNPYLHRFLKKVF